MADSSMESYKQSELGGLGMWQKSVCEAVPIRPPPLLQKVHWKFGYEALMVFHVPINFAHCSGVSTLKGACMNQREGEGEGEEKRGTEIGGEKGRRRGGGGERRERGRKRTE